MHQINIGRSKMRILLLILYVWGHMGWVYKLKSTKWLVVDMFWGLWLSLSLSLSLSLLHTHTHTHTWETERQRSRERSFYSPPLFQTHSAYSRVTDFSLFRCLFLLLILIPPAYIPISFLIWHPLCIHSLLQHGKRGSCSWGGWAMWSEKQILLVTIIH
jgi:hypothetical protein